jgi:hypothetical protein
MGRKLGRKIYPWAEYRKRWRDRHRELGLCASCSQKASVGLTHCIQCRRLAMKPILLCRFCGLNIPIRKRKPGIRLHDRCKIPARRARGRRKWPRLRASLAYITAHKKAVRKYQRKHKRLGLCRACSRPARAAYCPRHKH